MNRLSLYVSLVAVSLLAAPSVHAQGAAAPAPAAPAKAATLDELLAKVKESTRAESEELKAREQEFLAAKDKQQALLKQAQAALAAEEKLGKDLERKFEENEKKINEHGEMLRARLGTMGEMFGVVRTVAGETRNQLITSLVSSQHPNRGAALAQLADSKELPSIPQLETLWYTLLQEMTESGKIARYTARVVSAAGSEGEKPVIRVGPFNAISGGSFLRWDAEVGKLVELGRQPPSMYSESAKALEGATSGLVRGPIDPSRGQLLAMLIQTPDFWEHLSFGGAIGYITIALGLLAGLAGLIRWLQLSRAAAKVRRQQKDKTPREDNPLGRLLLVHAQNPDADTCTLERKLDEVSAAETAKAERFLWAIKLTSIVAPLLGLLGTVTGMIKTFQMITLFGAGDPKLMASGISEALVTTELGLVVAIPLTLLHGSLTSTAKQLADVISEQSAGLIAERSEQEQKKPSTPAAA